MRKNPLLLCSLAALAVCGAAHATSLLGQDVTATLSTDVPTTSFTQFTSPVTTFAGTDFTGGFDDFFVQDWVITVAFSADTITININTSNTVDGNVLNTTSAGAIDLTGFVGIPDMRFLSYSCSAAASGACGTFGGGPNDSILITDSSEFDVNFGVLRNGETYVFTAAPESGSWGLMILGAGLTGAAMRFRRRSTLA